MLPIPTIRLEKTTQIQIKIYNVICKRVHNNAVRFHLTDNKESITL